MSIYLYFVSVLFTQNVHIWSLPVSVHDQRVDVRDQQPRETLFLSSVSFLSRRSRNHLLLSSLGGRGRSSPGGERSRFAGGRRPRPHLLLKCSPVGSERGPRCEGRLHIAIFSEHQPASCWTPTCRSKPRPSSCQAGPGPRPPDCSIIWPETLKHHYTGGSSHRLAQNNGILHASSPVPLNPLWNVTVPLNRLWSVTVSLNPLWSVTVSLNPLWSVTVSLNPLWGLKCSDGNDRKNKSFSLLLFPQGGNKNLLKEARRRED